MKEQPKKQKGFVQVEEGYRAKEAKRARREERANNFDMKVLLEESEGEGDSGLDERNVSTESIKELKRVLNSVEKSQYEERHHAMISELRIRKMLAREKIKYPTSESFKERKQELR